MTWILRLLLILFILRALWRLFWGVVEGAAGPAPGERRPQQATPLVRDPVCGTFVVPGRALAIGRGDDTKYFCSEECRAKYRRAN